MHLKHVKAQRKNVFSALVDVGGILMPSHLKMGAEISHQIVWHLDWVLRIYELCDVIKITGGFHQLGVPQLDAL